jgi:hypothetical protein
VKRDALAAYAVAMTARDGWKIPPVQRAAGTQPSWARRNFVTPQFVSGTVLVSVVIAVADESRGISEVLVITIASMLILWVTDVFVQSVAAEGKRPDEPIHLLVSMRFALHRSKGLLYATVVPLFFLITGVNGLHGGDYAYWAALLAGVVILGAVGWVAFAKRGIPWYAHLLGAAATACLGAAAIVLKTLLK